MPGADGENHMYFPVEIEVVSAHDTAELHFPVEIEVLPSNAALDPDTVVEQALTRLAAGLDNTCP